MQGIEMKIEQGVQLLDFESTHPYCQWATANTGQRRERTKRKVFIRVL